MSVIDTAVFSASTWQQGTRGRLDPGATTLARLKDVWVCRDGLVRPRALWDYQFNTDAEGPTATNGGMTGPWWTGAYRGDNQLTTNQLFMFYVNSSSDFVAMMDEDGTDTDLTSADPSWELMGADYGNDYVWFTRIDRTKYLVMSDYLVSNDPDFGSGSWPSGPEVTVTSARTAIDTAFSLSSFQCWASTVFDGRAFYAGTAFGTQGGGRIYYSDLYDYTTFSSATQFFDVDGNVLGMVPLGSSMFIYTDASRWYSFVGGADPSTAVLRFLGHQTTPKWGYSETSGSRRRGSAQPRELNGVAYFISPEDSLCILTPDGRVDDQSLRHIDCVGSLVPDAAYDTLTVRSGTKKFYRMQYGVWTEENMYTTATLSKSSTNPMDRALTLDRDKEWLRTIRSSSSVDHSFVYSRDTLETNLPTADGSGSNDEETYANIDAQIHLPRLYVEGMRVRIREVAVDMTLEGSDGTGSRCDLEIEGPTETATFANVAGAYGTVWDANYNDSGRDGKRCRKIFSMLGPFQSHADVKLTDLRHVAIERVTVKYEVSKDRLL